MSTSRARLSTTELDDGPKSMRGRYAQLENAATNIRLPTAAMPLNGSTASTADEEPHAEIGTVHSARILVIDDEILLQELLVEALRREGHTVWGATNGHEGLGILDREVIDVVFTDLFMPEVSGWDVARAVKEKDPGVPVVLVTGGGEPDSQRLRDSGVDLVLTKPFRVEDLFSTLARALALCRAGPENPSRSHADAHPDARRARERANGGRLLFIVSRDRPDLYRYLMWHFSSQEDVEVILDGRRPAEPPLPGAATG